jgi:hypothetical protein
MEAMLGFRFDFWDHATFAALFFVTAVGLALAKFVLGLPGRIAIARNHPNADVVMRWAGSASSTPRLDSRADVGLQAHSWFNWLYPMPF